MKKIKIAIIGAGFVTQNAHLPSFSSDKRVEIVALCDVDKDLLQKVSSKYQIKNIYDNYKKMLSFEKIDAVVLSVQRSQTAKIAEFVIKKKIPILSEKPAALSFKIAKKLFNLSNKYKTKYCIGYMKRCDNGIIFLKSHLNRFNLGNLRSVYYESFLGDSYNNPFEYFQHKDKNYRKKFSLNKKLNSKKLTYVKYLNTFCHSINLIRYLFGEVSIDHKKINKDGEGFVTLKTKGDANIIFNTQFTTAKKWIEKLHLNFANGRVIVKLPTPLYKNSSASIKIENYKNGKFEKPWIKWGWSFRNQSKAFIDYIKKNKFNKSLCSGKNGLRDIQIIENIFYN